MSQRQVNLKPQQQFTQQAVGVVQQATQSSLNTIGRMQKAAALKKQQSQKAIAIGMQTSDALMDKYSDQVDSAPADTKAALNTYVRQEATIIGDLKAAASKPGATSEDVEAYQKYRQMSLSNLKAVATYSVNASQSQKIFETHRQAMNTNAMTGRLSDEALNNPDIIKFDSDLSSGFIKDFKVFTNTKTGHVEFGYTDDNGKPINRDIFAANETFTAKGSNLASYVIGADQNITGKTYRAELQNELKDFKDLVPVKSTKTVYNPKNNSETKTVVSGVVDYKSKLMDNHKDMLIQSTYKSNMSKTWTQLNGLGKIKGKEFDQPWSTFTQGDINDPASVKQAIENLKSNPAAIAAADADKSGTIEPSEYIDIQSKFREAAAQGIAELANDFFGQPIETTLTEQEITNKYKVDKTGRKTTSYTDSYKQTFGDNFSDYYKPAEDALKIAYADGGAFSKEENLIDFYRDNKDLVAENYNISIGNKQNIMDYNTLLKAYDKAELPIPEDLKKNTNGIFVINIDEGGQYKGGYNMIADDRKIKFKNGKLTPESKKNLFRTIGVEFSLYENANNSKLRKESSDYLPKPSL
tara:strand:+ start:1626 stop:3371 length:1746 start_codon:yes stop_codon:yes gene_type:complete